MKWAHVAAGALATLCAVSYAAAGPLEAQLGKPALRARPGAPHGPAPRFEAPTTQPSARFGRVLANVAEPPVAATRGAADSRIYQHAARSVVLVVTDRGLGSGALITPDGQIITNLHVVQGAKTIGVVFKPAVEGAAPGKADMRRAEVVKIDEVADLALLKVAEVPAGVQPIPLGDSNRLQVGADVHAIGHPTGETWTYTRGVVSQVRRAYDWKPQGDKVQHEATVIQTQTPINPGNSGGPLLDDSGALVGINSFTSEGEGLNFAVSVEDVKTFLARGHDRNVAAQPVKDCKWTEMDTRDSKDPPGKLHVLDTDCDGQEDSALFIAKNRRTPDVLMTDINDKGEYDTFYFDANHDGKPDWALYDTDSDGKPDLRGEFRNGESEPYRWEKISG